MEKKNRSALSTGREGERLAEDFLIEKGYRLAERNYRYKRCEIDLIMHKDGLTIFIEVKTRQNAAFGNPEEFVSPAQAERIMEAAGQYLEQQGCDSDIRFDIVAVIRGNPVEILHLEDAIS